MLHPAQQPPGIEQLLHIAFIQQPAAGQQLQGLRCAAFAQGRILPAAHDLEHLCAEFDFADAAASQLHVEAGIVALGATGFGFHGFGADQVVQPAQCGKGRKIQIRPEHEGHHLLHQLLLVGTRAVEGGQPRVRDHATLEPRKALPLASLFMKIAAQCRQRGNQRPHVAIGAQAGVHAKHEAVGRHAGEQLVQALGHALHVARIFAGIARHVDEVDVGRDVQLAAAQLAHAHHHHVLWPAFGVEQGASLCLQLGGGHLQGMAHGHLGPVGDGAQHFFQRGFAADVALHQRHHQQVAKAAQGHFRRLAVALVAYPGFVDGDGGEGDADERVEVGRAAIGTGGDDLQVAAEEGAVGFSGVGGHGGGCASLRHFVGESAGAGRNPLSALLRWRAEGAERGHPPSAGLCLADRKRGRSLPAGAWRGAG